MGKEPKSKPTDRIILRCGHFVNHKNRYCKMMRKESEKYCAQHSIERNGKKRIPCPYSSNHTVWDTDLKYHLEHCRQKPVVQNDPWYRKDMNVVGADEKAFDDDGKVDFKRWLDTIERVFATIEEPVEKDVKNHEGLKERLMEVDNTKHASQQASLIGHMDGCGLLKNPVVSEFGAGRGELSRYISRTQGLIGTTTNARQYLLIDRASPRRKFDTKIKDDAVRRGETEPVVYRIKIDIKDFDLNIAMTEKFGENSIKNAVSVVSKHLCGCATDLTLECIRNGKQKVFGVAIALCCRQLCSYETFPTVGKEWLKNNGIGIDGFKTLTRMTSWAVTGPGNSKSEHEHEQNDEDNKENETLLTIDQRREYGLKARRLIDYARLLSVRDMNYKAKLVEYIDFSVSPENICLLAYKE